MYRSAGWPLLDTLELELLAAGLLERVADPSGHERVRLTDAGIAAAVLGAQSNRAALNAHESLVAAVVRMQQHKGHLAWRGLSLRVDVRNAHAALGGDAAKAKWVLAMPDVFSLRNTTVPGYLRATVHEVKVKRADVLGELKKPLKTAAYVQMCSELWMVLGCDAKGKPIAQADELPEQMGVVQAWPTANGFRFELLRQPPHRDHQPSFSHWMALAKSMPEPQTESAQALLR
jgi:hypothetical protein